jgi:UPF0755 protein
MRKLAVVLLVLLVVAAGAAGAWIQLRVKAPFRGYSGVEQFVEIPPGASTRAIGDRLVAAGIVRDTLTFRAALWLSGEARHLKAGEYRFDSAMTPADVIVRLARGDVFVVNFTVPEGLTVAEVAKLFESHGFGPAGSFVEAARNASLIHELDPAARDLEGYLFPETYPLPRHVPAAKVVAMMVDRFDKTFTADMRAAAEGRGLTVRQAVTLGSIVEKETARGDERPVVAGVYTNRLRIGMPLQCDPTVIYALAKAGRYNGNIHKDDLSIDSPYNTYRYPGLPPGPIASPGKASLEAAVHPSDTGFLYFVSRNDGSHEFARSLEEHNRNVQKFQIKYFRDRRHH